MGFFVKMPGKDVRKMGKNAHIYALSGYRAALIDNTDHFKMTTTYIRSAHSYDI